MFKVVWRKYTSRHLDFERFPGFPAGDPLADLSDFAADRDRDDLACKHQTHTQITNHTLDHW